MERYWRQIYWVQSQNNENRGVSVSKYRLSDLQKRMLVACCKEGKLWRSEIATKCGYSYKRGSKERNNVERAISRSLRRLLVRGLIGISDSLYDRIGKDEAEKIREIVKDEQNLRQHCETIWKQYPSSIKTKFGDFEIFVEEEKQYLIKKIEWIESEVQHLLRYTSIKYIHLTAEGADEVQRSILFCEIIPGKEKE